MPLSQSGDIEKIYNQINNSAENKIIKNEERLSLEERKRKTMPKAKEVLENANIAAVANDLLSKFTIKEIDGMTEEELNKYCHDYDVAVIANICKQIEINRIEST